MSGLSTWRVQHPRLLTKNWEATVIHIQRTNVCGGLCIGVEQLRTSFARGFVWVRFALLQGFCEGLNVIGTRINVCLSN